MTKTQQAITAYERGDHLAALRVAKDFRLGLTREERAALCRAYECYIRPDFYQQIGRDPLVAEIERGLEVFRAKIMPK